MSLRDIIAIAALPALIEKDALHAQLELLSDGEYFVDNDGGLHPPREKVYDFQESYYGVANGAYALADAMLLARQGRAE